MNIKQSVILGLLAATHLVSASQPAEAEALPALIGPPAPFKPKTNKEKMIKPKGQVAGRKILFGSKKLIVNPSGSMMFMSNGRTICRIYFHVNTEWCAWLTNVDWNAVPVKWKKGYVGITESTYDEEEKQFVIKGDFPLNKPKTSEPAIGRFVETVQLLDDEKVKVDVTYDIPEKVSNFFKGGCVFLESSALENFVIDGNERRFDKEKTTSERFLEPGVVHFAPDKPNFNFNLEVLSPAVTNARMREEVEDFRVYPFKCRNISFIIDPGAIPARSPSKTDETFGGVNFSETDDLEVPNYSASRNLLRNPSFEQGTMFYMARSHTAPFRGIDNIKADDQDAIFGKHSLRVDTTQPGFTLVLSPVPLDPGEYTFSFYVKGNNPRKQKVTAYFWNVGFRQIARMNCGVSEEWKRHSHAFEIKKPMAVSIWLTPSTRAPDGTIWLDGLQLERGGVATEFTSQPIEGRLTTSQPDNFLALDEPIDAKLQISSLEPEQSGKVLITVENFFGEKLIEESYEFKTDATGLAEAIELPFNGKLPEGIHMVKAAYALDNGDKCHDHFRVSIMPKLRNAHKLKSMFANSYSGSELRVVYPGLETYLKRCRDIGVGGETHAGIVTKEFEDLMEKYGIKVVNCFLADRLYDEKGKKVKDEKGRIFFGIYDRENGNELLLKDYKQEGDGKLTDDYLSKFEESVSSVVKRHPWIPLWAFSGESWAKWPDWLTNDRESFAKIQIAFHDAVKKANPKLQVYNGSPCNIYPEDGTKKVGKILETINGRIKYDALAIHPYLPDGPYSLEANVEAFMDMAREHGYKDTPVFFPEGVHYGPYTIPQWGIKSAAWGRPRCWYFGTLSYDMGWTEKLSAAWFARTWLIMMKHMDRVLSCTSSAINMISNFHLDSKLTPRAYQKIPNTLGHLLGDSRFVADASFAPKTKCLIFEDERERPVAAVWSEIPLVDQGIEECPWAVTEFEDDDIEIFDLMGAPRSLKQDDAGRLHFPMSIFPHFLRGKPSTTASFAESLKNAAITGGKIAPLKMTAKLAAPNSVDLIFDNLISREISGDVEAGGRTERIDIAPRKRRVLSIPLASAIPDDKIANVEIPVKIAEAGNPEVVNENVSFRGFLCKRANSPIQIDGDETDWKDIPAIPLENRWIDNSEGEKRGYEGDFNGSFKVAWDKNNLYLLVKIEDDQFTHQVFDNNAKRCENDSLQIYFDTKCDARNRKFHGYDVNDYDYAVFPDPDGEATTFRYRSPDRQLTLGTEAPQDRTVEPHIPSAFRTTKDGYAYEIAFPAKYLLPASLENNYAMGFGLFVNDRDAGKRTKQALTLTPPGTGCYRKPHLYPVMLLTE